MKRDPNDRSPRFLNKPRWGLFQWGTLWEVFYFRGDALKLARQKFEENKSGKQKCWRELFEIHKIYVRLAGKGE